MSIHLAKTQGRILGRKKVRATMTLNELQFISTNQENKMIFNILGFYHVLVEM